MSAQTAADLRAARTLIKARRKWGQRITRRALPDGSIQRCSIAAMLDVTICVDENSGDRFARARRALLAAMNADDISDWQDRHSHADVLAAFDRAIAAQQDAS